jgi:hypothetical protein
MAGSDSETSNSATRTVHDLVAQLRAMTEKVAGLAGLTGLAETLPGIPALPSLLRPAALVGAQLKAVTSTVAAQRRSIEAMQAHLTAFDEQLTVMEAILEPLMGWTAAWTDLEETVMGERSDSEG